MIDGTHTKILILIACLSLKGKNTGGPDTIVLIVIFKVQVKYDDSSNEDSYFFSFFLDIRKRNVP